MATTAVNNIVRSVSPKSLFESAYPVLSSASNWNQGDILAYDATNKILNAVTGTGSSANLCGVAVQSIVSGKVPSPYQGTAVDASQAISDVEGPQYGIVCFFKLTSGDAFFPGVKVYIGADAQTVTVTAGGNSIGIFQGTAITPSGTGFVGDVLTGARYGFSDINF